MRIFKKAFTLIELLIYMGLLSVLLLVMTQIFVSVLDVRKDTEALSSVEQDGNYIMTRFMHDIARATSIVTPSGAGGEGNTLQITIGGVSHTYTLNNANLEINDGTGAYRLNGTGTTLTNLTFERIGPGDSTDTVQVTFTITSQVTRSSGTQSKTYQTTVASRQ